MLVPEQGPRPLVEFGGVAIGTSVVTAGFAIDLRADALVDAMSRALLVRHRDAIASGQKPEGGPQRPLSEGRRNDADREKPVRGYKTGHLADNLRRSKITGTTAKATAKILPPSDRNVFVALELERGVHYFSVEGEAGEAAGQAARDIVDAMAAGDAVDVKRGGD